MPSSLCVRSVTTMDSWRMSPNRQRWSLRSNQNIRLPQQGSKICGVIGGLTQSGNDSKLLAVLFFMERVMATTEYFNETIKDQGEKGELDVEFGRSSFYPEDSIYLSVDGKMVIMDRKTAKKFVESAIEVGVYHGFVK